MRTKIINDQLTDLFYNFIEMEDRIAANDRYADLNSSDMRFLSAVGKGSHPRTITQVGDYLRVGTDSTPCIQQPHPERIYHQDDEPERCQIPMAHSYG